MSFVRGSALAIGIAGFALFGSAFFASIAASGFFENAAKGVIRYEVEKKVHEKVEAIDSRFLSKKTEIFAKGHAGEISQTRQLLAQAISARLAQIIAEMQDPDCECRKKVETSIGKGFDWRIAGASAVQERLTGLIRLKYMETFATSFSIVPA